MNSPSRPEFPTEARLPPSWIDAGACFRVDRFLVGPEIGQGGMGRVHEAWDPTLCRRLAVKLLHSAAPEATLRLLYEARAQARLDHPGICRIYEVGSAPESPYIAMQLVEGPALGALAGTLRLEEILRILADVAGTVHAAHRAGLIHRDLKPSNILVERRRDGSLHPIVVDFGLALDLTASERTLSWGMAGTPAFMSPEQGRGEAMTPASDIYSLGATLFALLSGHPPLDVGTLAGLLTQHSVRDAPRLRKVLPRTPRDLETIVQKCLEIEPRRRYTSAFALEEELRRYLAGESIHARSVGLPERAWRQVKRHRSLSMTLAVSLLLLAGLGGWSLRQRRVAARQVELAQRFGGEVKEVENLLRVERLLPLHELRSTEDRVRGKLESLRSTMDRLGAVAQGPGHYALGRVRLALREYEEAITEFDLARRAGFGGPELAYAQGLAHAALFESGLLSLAHIQDLQARAAQRGILYEKHGKPALEGFREGRGGALESGALGEARLALLEGNFELCLAKCRETLREMPSEYEAHLVASRAWSRKSMIVHGHGDGAAADASRVEAERELAGAGAIARSDVDLLTERLVILSAKAVRQSESGLPDRALFRESEQLIREGLVLRPQDPELWHARMGTIYRESFIRLAAGEDCLPWLQEQLELGHRAPRKPGEPSPATVLHWLQGEALWRFGGDPRATLEEGLGQIQGLDTNESEMRGIRARYLAQHGLDPLPDLERAEEICRGVEASHNWESYHQTVWGEVLLMRAQWERDSGREATASIREGIRHLELSIRRAPGVVYAHFHLPLLRALEARLLVTQGRDPGPAVEAALKAAQGALAIRANHYRSQLASAEAHRVAALAAHLQGRDPQPDLEAAGRALAAGLRLNPTDFRLHLALARLALDGHAWGDGGGAALDRAEAATLQGLRTKADAPELWIALAKARRLKAGGPCPGARAALSRALALDPRRPEALEEAAQGK